MDEQIFLHYILQNVCVHLHKFLFVNPTEYRACYQAQYSIGVTRIPFLNWDSIIGKCRKYQGFAPLTF